MFISIRLIRRSFFCVGLLLLFAGCGSKPEKFAMSGYWGSWLVATSCSEGACKTAVQNTGASDPDDRALMEFACSESELVPRGGQGKILVCPRAFDPTTLGFDTLEDFKALAEWNIEKLPKNFSFNLEEVGSATVKPSEDGKITIKMKGGSLDDIHSSRSRREIRIDNPDVDVEIEAPEEFWPQIEVSDEFGMFLDE